jgi:catechol 2,3-dioxygenase-like lactoylglutathione lyase family enzyme
MRFHHVGISVSDIERSIAFYRDMLGMEKLCEVFPFSGEKFEQIMDVPGATGRMCVIGNGSLNLELFQFDKAKDQDPDYPVSNRGISHFGVEVDDVAATYAKLHAANVRMHTPVLPMTNTVDATYCRDPDGNVFEILEMHEPR